MPDELSKCLHVAPGTYTYYTLGMSLLPQGKTNEAISAFTLEALANPSFLTTSVWEEPALFSIKDDVVTRNVR